MRVLRPITRMSVRCSRDREAVLAALRRLGRATAEEIARESRVRLERVLGALHGDGEAYALDLALVRLGIVTSVPTPFGPAFSLSTLGSFEAECVEQLRVAGRAV